MDRLKVRVRGRVWVWCRRRARRPPRATCPQAARYLVRARARARARVRVRVRVKVRVRVRVRVRARLTLNPNHRLRAVGMAHALLRGVRPSLPDHRVLAARCSA